MADAILPCWICCRSRRDNNHGHPFDPGAAYQVAYVEVSKPVPMMLLLLFQWSVIIQLGDKLELQPPPFHQGDRVAALRYHHYPLGKL
jgi:hypothetical protein